jgi:hypothetical protein
MKMFIKGSVTVLLAFFLIIAFAYNGLTEQNTGLKIKQVKKSYVESYKGEFIERNALQTYQAVCPQGMKVLSGGYTAGYADKMDNGNYSPVQFSLISNKPIDSGEGWEVQIIKENFFVYFRFKVDVYAVCASAGQNPN